MELPKIRTAVFVCTGWSCPKCEYNGDIEVHTLGIGLPENRYQAGDPIGEGVVGNINHFDAFLCPRCIENADFTLYGVTLHVSDGRYSGSVFC